MTRVQMGSAHAAITLEGRYSVLAALGHGPPSFVGASWSLSSCLPGLSLMGWKRNMLSSEQGKARPDEVMLDG